MAIVYSKTSKETKFPIQPLYNCFFLENNMPIFVQPNSGVYGEVVDCDVCKDFFKDFETIPSKKIFVSKFFWSIEYRN